jgi:hypothetical protein
MRAWDMFCNPFIIRIKGQELWKMPTKWMNEWLIDFVLWKTL